MNNNKLWLYLLIALAFYLVGCKENPTGQVNEFNDQDALKELITNDALFTSEQTLLNDGDPTTTGLQKGTATINPLRWGRKIVSFERNVDFIMLTDSMATAIVTNLITGYLWIKQVDTTLPVITKNFIDTTKRIIKFSRVNRLGDKRKNWKISAISAMKGGTASAGIQIQKVTFIIGNDSINVVDPLNRFFEISLDSWNRWRLRSIPANFNDSLKVRLELISVDPVSDIVSVHKPYLPQYSMKPRALMKLISSTPTGDGKYLRVYENAWKSVWAGRHHVIASAITRESIYDDVKPFNSEYWGIPFIVE